MLEYFKKGWHGDLRFSEVVFSHQTSSYLLDGGIAYIGFYILLIICLTQNSFNLENMFVYPLLLYGVVFYVWLLKAFWGSANHCSNSYSAVLIRIFTLLLPVISILAFILIILYYLISALIDAFN